MAGPVPPRVHMDEVLRAGYHRSGLPRTGPESPRAGPRNPHVEARPPGGLSLLSSQGARTPLPARIGVRSRHVLLWARLPDPRVRCRHVSHMREPPDPASSSGRGPELLRASMGAGVRRRHVSHRCEPPLPTRIGVRSRHVSLWAQPLTSGSGTATCPTGASLPPEASPLAALDAGG